MTIGSISPKDNIVRYASPARIRKDGFADGSAFCLRIDSSDESGLSVNWLECFPGDKEKQLAEVRRLSWLELKKRGRFAEMNVGDITNLLSSLLPDFAVVNTPLSANETHNADPSHSEIFGLPKSDPDFGLLVGEMIAQSVVAMHPAVISS